MRRGARALSLALVAGCAVVGLPAAAPAGAAAATPDAAEETLIAAHDAQVRRAGERLEIRLPGAPPLSFTDRSCEALEGDDCVLYRLDAVFAGRDSAQPPLFGVAEQYYEGGTYTLIASDGTMIETGARPVSSPDGRLLVAAASSDSHPPDTGIVLLERTDQGIVRVIRAIPTGSLTNYAALRWIGSSCVGFSASVSDEGAYGPQEQFYLAEAEPEWRLTRDATACGQDADGR